MTTASTLVAALCLIAAFNGAAAQAPKAATTLVSEVESGAPAPTSADDPFGIFSDGYDPLNYGLNGTGLYEYDTDLSAYTECTSVPDTFAMFADSNISVSVFQDLLNATATAAPQSKADSAMKGVSVSALKANATLLQKTVDQYIFKLPPVEDVPDIVLNATQAIGQTLSPFMTTVEPEVAASTVSMTDFNMTTYGEYGSTYLGDYVEEPMPIWSPICGGGLMLLLNATLKA